MKNKKSNFFQNFIFLNLVLILSIFLYSCSSAKSQDKKLKKTYLQNMNLKGKVKSVRIIYYEAIDKFGELQKGKKESTFDESRFVRENYECNYKIIFNDKGNMIEENWYNSDGILVHKKVYKYDDKGNMIEKNIYYSDLSPSKNTYKYDNNGNMIEQIWYESNDIINKDVYTYDDKGNMIEENSYNSNVSLGGKQVFKYDDNGNMIEENWYNSDGGIDWKSIHKYDDKGNMIENNWYNSNSSFDWKHIYKYDGKGNMVEKNEYKSDGIINNKYTYNEYDKFDNWVKRIDYKNEIPQFIVEREIEYY